MQRTSEPHSESQRIVCPGLSQVIPCDARTSLRGELYTSEHLASHAVEIAEAHGKPSFRNTPGPLRKRFAGARSQIRLAYEILSRDAKSKRDPSPAEEWLLDNSHVVDEQIREIQEDLPWGYLIQLPRIETGVMRGYPRVYALCLDYLRHTDARVDLNGLADYVSAYQRVFTLTIGELWAVPIMLRLGLTLIVGALAVSEAAAQDRELADGWADRLISDALNDERLARTLKQLDASGAIVSDGFLVQLLKRVREHDAPLKPVQAWISARCAAANTTPEELTRREHLRQAADQVSVGNSITSMRAIAALDWSEFFELTSGVERVLQQDPCGAYPQMDPASRDRCRHAVEKLARRSRLDERAVAEQALALARAQAETPGAAPAEHHVGYFLLDTGRRRLAAAIGYRPTLRERVLTPVLSYPSAFYASALVVMVGGACLATAQLLLAHIRSGWAVLGLTLLCALPLSELALSLLNALVVFVLPPRLLPKLDFEDGIPDEHRTLVAVPTLLENRAGVTQLIEDLEVRALANADKNLYFALVTDFRDADEAEAEGDSELLQLARDGIAELNGRSGKEARYFLLHRRRVLNPVEGRFMGWERKRGKLEELNRLLRGATDTSFDVVTASPELCATFRYVLTLDTDTELPREVARRMVGAMAHPQNRPLLDPTRQRVVRGYGVIQPRVGTLPLSSRRSQFARIFAGPPGIDPYTTAVSDVYQDLFGEGSFVGKGIYDIDAFEAAMRGRVPEGRLLSHDLFEGCFARSALATDIEVLDEQPATYEVVTSRAHRWLRGDWQLLPWLWSSVPVRGGGRRPNDFRLLDYWKLLDNLRRSLVPPALVAVLFWAWVAAPALAPWALGLLAGVFLGPLLVREVLSFARAATAPRPQFGALGGQLSKNLLQLALGVMLLLDQALLSCDGILRTLYRLTVSRRYLLEWTTMSQAARRGARLSRRFASSAWLAFAAIGIVASTARASLPFALPLLLSWLAAPAVMGWLGRLHDEPAPDAHISEPDLQRLRSLARKTWRFFDTFVTARDNWLPPDNYQEDPRGVVAHRTSPTNIGLYLLSVVSARDLGFISASQALVRLENTLATLSRMERRSGHILNWYDTTNLRPLEPQYVSTVDSGNLAAYLWTLREASAELARMPLFDAQALEAARDALRLATANGTQDPKRPEQAAVPMELVRLDRKLAEATEHLDRNLLESLSMFTHLEHSLERLATSSYAQGASAEARYWLGQAAAGVAAARVQASELGPCLAWLSAVPALPRDASELLQELVAQLTKARTPAELGGAAANFLEELPNLEQASPLGRAGDEAAAFFTELGVRLRATERACSALTARADSIAQQAVDLADGMDFGFLYDKGRALFSIGYNVSGARLDGSHYDLLASEARLASLVAISKGDAPLEHWWKLARPRTATSAGRALVSWSGSMFEYLMPLLVTGANRDTLLWETCQSAVGRQRDYGAEQQRPWGISEAAYNVMDLAMNYQYRAFGVPGLGLQSGLAEDLVVAPYATVLATLVRPDFALENLRELDREGLDGKYGYYEAIDYTPGHVPPQRRSVVVKAFMAHHQGMSLVALCNVLCNWPMQRRFFADARVRASALLLEERVPLSAVTIPVRASQNATPLLGEPELRLTDHVGLGATGVERLHLLGQGELSTIVSARGNGVTTWKGLDVTRFREDAALGAGGTYVYVRNLSAKRLWSAGQQPTGATPDYYDASFSIDRVELKRRDGAVETVMEITVSPEHPAEVRRITLTNHGDRAVELDVTSYTEPVLAPRAADVAHRAFSSMFLEAELLPERGAILLRRRPRSASEAETWLIQVLTPDDDNAFGPATLDASRAEFLGRNGSLARPQALRFDHQLSGSSGNVLDPGLALQRRVKLEPDGRARLTLTTALATSREAALELLDLINTPHSTARAFELAWADARVELKHLGITAARSHRFQRLLSCLIYAPPALREAATSEQALTRGRGALWSQGISGDLPILLLRIDSPDFPDLCNELLLAHEFWRLNGVNCDLVIVNDEPEGYLHPLQMALEDLIRSSPAQGRENQSSGVFLRRSAQLSPEEHTLLQRAARVVLRSSAGSLSQQLRRASEPVAAPAALATVRRRPTQNGATAAPLRDLSFFNGIGGFSADGREYVMNIGPGSKPPAPWCNVLANPHFGSVVSESGLGFSWSDNSQRNRLTPWSNDAVCDPAGELLYLRDESDGELWSATPAPASHSAHFSVRHGQGYSIYAHAQHELEHELTTLVSPSEPVKLLRLRLKNRGSAPRKLSIYAVVEWVMGPSREAARLHVGTQFDAKRGVLLANNPFAHDPGQHAFIAASLPVASFSGDRQEVFGQDGSRERPAALERACLSNHVGVGLDPCGALQLSLTLPPGPTVEVCIVLGIGASAAHAHALAERFVRPEEVELAYQALGPMWDELCAVSVRTPDPSFNLLVSRWLMYQAVGARLWARSGFYQSSGAYGFRDQLQDVLALVHARPDLAREHLLRAAGRQFAEGDVQHWWHPETGEGVRTHCSDDLLFLPYVVAAYVRATGDRAVLDESVPFLEERQLATDEDDVFSAPRHGSSGSMYEHCRRALKRGTTQGPHGLPKIGSGDWNDGMNRVGQHGTGESIWLGWFLIRTLKDFAVLARARGDQEHAEGWRRSAEAYLLAIEAHGWDGDWYRRAYYDDGTPLGSRDNQECRIDAIAQSWSVIAGGNPERASRAVASSVAELVLEDERLMRLLDPPFGGPEHDPGYIRSYPAGVRENGGQYTHGVLWTVQALCLLGEGEQAHHLFSLLNPIHHATTPSEVKRYRVEPYVLAADVYASSEHSGRGGWTWYTGSASWMWRIAIENMLGLQRRGDALEVSPCIPPSWPEFEVTYRHGNSELLIHVENPSGVAVGVRRIELDGRELSNASVPLVDDGRRHRARVVMGPAAASAGPGRSIRPATHSPEAE